MKTKKEKIRIIRLGCAKNNVDAEVIAGLLEENGIEIVDEETKADIVLINTCSFIQKAKEESIETILNASALKDKGEIKRIIVTGCLPQRYGKRLRKEIPEIDAIAGIDDIPHIINYVSPHANSKPKTGKKKPAFIYNHKLPRKRFTPQGTSYVKIADGCSNNCTYCSIPSIRGELRCRSVKSITEEVKMLAGEGTVEINLIAQDLTAFSPENSRDNLKSLLISLEKISGLKWIRPLYLYPSKIDNELIDIIASSDKICSYFDIPIQHTEDKILSGMGRKYRRSDIESIITRIRTRIPDALLRTTLITGFPGESDSDFKSMLEFIKQTRFDRLGIFTYSREEETPAYRFKGHIPKKTSEERALLIEKTQRRISAEKNRTLIGTIHEAIAERISEEEGFFEGRIKSQAPEVDGITFIQGKNIACGKIYRVEIVDAVDFDLTAELAG